jgi:hypothetical protein
MMMMMMIIIILIIILSAVAVRVLTCKVPGSNLFSGNLFYGLKSSVPLT